VLNLISVESKCPRRVLGGGAARSTTSYMGSHSTNIGHRAQDRPGGILRAVYVGVVVGLVVLVTTDHSLDSKLWGSGGAPGHTVASSQYRAINISVPAELASIEASSCVTYPVDQSVSCTQAALAEVNYARQVEGAKPLSLPADWYGLTVAEQTLVVVNSERSARGMSHFVGLSHGLDALASQGVAASADPPLPVGAWGSSIWAGGYDNVLLADYAWMYNDGPGGQNAECTATDNSGCYGHRDAILTPCSGCFAGAASSSSGSASLGAVFVGGWRGPVYFSYNPPLRS
jgi:hypothetical protein